MFECCVVVGDGDTIILWMLCCEVWGFNYVKRVLRILP